MLKFLVTLIFAFLLFLLFGCASMLCVLLGRRKNQRRCACSAAKQVMKEYEQRQRERKNCTIYDPKTVEPKNLPIIKS